MILPSLVGPMYMLLRQGYIVANLQWYIQAIEEPLYFLAAAVHKAWRQCGGGQHFHHQVFAADLPR